MKTLAEAVEYLETEMSVEPLKNDDGTLDYPRAWGRLQAVCLIAAMHIRANIGTEEKNDSPCFFARTCLCHDHRVW